MMIRLQTRGTCQTDRGDSPTTRFDAAAEGLLQMARDAGARVGLGARILDFGCGYGDTVAYLRSRGFDAQGVDVVDFWNLDPTRGWERDHPPVGAEIIRHLHLAEFGHNYSLPFPEQSFDVVMSNMVFEHVMDYRAAFQAITRVLRPNGISVHVFAPRWSPLEQHTLVPFAGVWRTYSYLSFWALVGIRNRFQTGEGWRKVASLNAKFLREETNYPTAAEIVRWAEQSGLRATFVGSRRGLLATIAAMFLRRKMILRPSSSVGT